MVCNQAASFNRCLFKVQSDMQTQIKTICGESKGKGSNKATEATEELQFLMDFNASITQAAAKVMEHLTDFVFITMGNLTLACRDVYLNHLKNGIKPDALAALRTGPLHIEEKEKLPIMIARVSLHLLQRAPKVGSTLMKGVRGNQRVGRRLSRKGPHERTLTEDNLEEARARIPTSLRDLPRANSHTNDNHCTDRFPGRLLAGNTLTEQTMNNCLDQNVNFHVVKVVPSAPGHSQKKEISPGMSECYMRNHTLKSVKSVSCVTQLSCVKPVTNAVPMLRHYISL